MNSSSLPDYAELHCVSHFSFLRGASHPEELIERAHAQGYQALALTDECSLAGVVRAHQAAKSRGFHLLIGAEFVVPPLDAPPSPAHSTLSHSIDARTPPTRLVLLAQNRAGYGALSALISQARMRAPKHHYQLLPSDLDSGLPGCLAVLIPSPTIPTRTPSGFPHASHHPPEQTQARFIRERFGTRAWLGVALLARGDETQRLADLSRIAKAYGLPLVATGDVHYHVRSRRTLQDVLTATRLRRPIHQLGRILPPNAEQHLRSRARLAQIYPPALLDQTLVIATQCNFSLDSLRYEYPDEIVPPGITPSSWLRQRTMDGLQRRYPQGVPAKVHALVEHELTLIAELAYEPYFLTVADLVAFARQRNILCQGRGSAANSAVCYALGITEVDPTRISMLFERFISRERHEPPDIDIDVEHQRREEVFQYLYAKYGRERTALTGAVNRYRPRSALRDVGRALGIDAHRLALLTRSHAWWDGSTIVHEHFERAGFDTTAPIVQQWMNLTKILIGTPRHLSQHSGGIIIARDSLTHLVPIENAAMPGRTVVQWDKDDLDALGLLKVDVLALGMLSALHHMLDLITARRHKELNTATPFTLQDIPAEDPDTYAMLAQGDTVGVFQVESRAQMNMLPRLRPRCFYDLVIQIAIVRPGPIQGGMVHPYLRRRQGLETIDPLDKALEPALARTLGVPIFQEQVMQIAVLAAGFTPGQADQLRRAMAAWRRQGNLSAFQKQLIEGMRTRGHDPELAQRIAQQIEGFGEYGFPESHAASFALLVYVSAWLKCHEPAAFLAGLLNAQPLGFYAPAQLVRDARAHGVTVLGPCVLHSDWFTRLEETTPAPANLVGAVDTRPQPIVRLGLHQVTGLSREAGHTLLAIRSQRQHHTPPFKDVEDLACATQLDRASMQALAQANALAELAGHRAQAVWQTAAITRRPSLFKTRPYQEAPLTLPPLSAGEDLKQDYVSLGIPMEHHPLALLRTTLTRYKVQPASVLRTYPHGRLARASGLVTHRQRPSTAKGVLFITLEDDTGTINVIVWPRLVEQTRGVLLHAQLLTVYGTWQIDPQAQGAVPHLIAQRVVDHSHLLTQLFQSSRDEYLSKRGLDPPRA